MADHTKIEWTDATWNPITGCSVISPGCTNCYAMKLAGTRMKNHPSRSGLTRESKAGPVWTGDVRFNRDWLMQPLQWAKARMIFVCAHGDLFAEGVQDEWIDQVFAVMALAHQHTFQVLTKRPERMRSYLSSDDFPLRLENAIDELSDNSWDFLLAIRALPNVWLGVSVEDQPRADQRIPILLETPAAVRWISAEPLLNRIYAPDLIARLDWVAVGGESGPDARPMHPDWARSLRDQCASVGVPFLFKQWGSWKPVPWKVVRNDGETDVEYIGRSEAECSQHAISKTGFIHEMSHKPWSCERVLPQPESHHAVKKVGKKAAGRHLDGVLHDAFPEAR